LLFALSLVPESYLRRQRPAKFPLGCSPRLDPTAMPISGPISPNAREALQRCVRYRSFCLRDSPLDRAVYSFGAAAKPHRAIRSALPLRQSLPALSFASYAIINIIITRRWISLSTFFSRPPAS
jgi:hypothetical protein